MSHTQHDQKKVLARVRKIRGQLEGVERMLTEQRGCYEILQAIAACRGAMNGLMATVLEEHIRFHVMEQKGRQAKFGAEEVISVVKSYLR